MLPASESLSQGRNKYRRRNVSGVSQRAFGQLNIRGFGAGASSSPSGLGITNFSLGDVEQIEVLKGPAAVLYGSGEPGGTINIATKQPGAEPRYELQAIIGNFDFYRPSLDITGPLNEDQTILYRFNAFYENSGSFIDFVENEEFGFFPVLSFQLGKDTNLTIEGNYRKDTSNAGSFVDITDGLPARATVIPNPLGKVPRSRYQGEPDFNDSTFTVPFTVVFSDRLSQINY